MRADNGVRVSAGTASLYDHSAPALKTRDLRPHHNGPLLQDQTYVVNAQVVAVSESPKTESLWFDSTAHDSNGHLVVTQRMMLRFMKDSSPLYQ